jgi:hypothetical protein
MDKPISHWSHSFMHPAKNHDLEPASLRDSLFLFEVCARRTLEICLRVPTQVTKKFEFANIFSNPFSSACMIRSGNQIVSASVFLGFEATETEKLIPKLDRRLDVLGEITNVIAGNCFGNSLFSSSFGFIGNTLPVFLHAKIPVQETACIQGMLQAGSLSLFTALLVDPLSDFE